MVMFAFLLGGAFGISMSSLFQLVESVYKNGLDKDTLTDIIYEGASLVFVFALLDACIRIL
jgi:hypothetical protein